MDLLKLLANKTNSDILALLQNEPTYPRRIAALLEKKEQKVVPRLKAMEEAGLLKSSWGRVAGKNVKIYKVQAAKMEVAFGRQGLELGITQKDEAMRAIAPPLYLAPKIDADPRFVGREEELEAISSSSDMHNIVIVEGMSGIGKSSLLQAVASRVASDCALFWHTFKETDSFDYLVAKLAAFLAELDYLDLFDYIAREGKEDSAKLDLLTRGVERPKRLLIFDDYQRHRDEKIDMLLGHLQRETSLVRVIVGTRVRPRFLTLSSNLLELQLEGLSLEESSQLMRKWGLRLDRGELAKIHRKTSGQPFALTLLASIIKKDPGALDDLPKAELALERVSDELLQSLGENERELLVSISAFRNPIPETGIIELFKRRNVRYSLHSLEKRMVLKRNGDNYLLNEIVREGCYKLLDNPSVLHEKIAAWYLPRRSIPDALEGLYHLVRARDASLLKDLLRREATGEGYDFVGNGYSAALLDIISQIPQPLIKKEDVWCLWCVRLIALSALQKWREAKEMADELEQASKSMMKQNITAHVLQTLAQYHSHRGDLAEAETLLLKSCDIFRASDDSASLARVYLQLARLYFAEGEPLESMKYVELEARISTAKAAERQEIH